MLTDFYIDVYKPLKLETLNSIARFYLALQIEENKAKRLNKKYGRFDDDEEELIPKEIQLFSSVMADLHLISYQHYLHIFKRDKRFNAANDSNKLFMPKPFTVSMFKQVSLCFRIYMKRIREQETIKIEKFERSFKKIDQVKLEIKGYDIQKEEINKKLENLKKLLGAWDEKIEKQKDVYKIAIEECRKEEKLVDEMSKALEKLKQDVSRDTQDVNNLLSPQYEMALKAIESLNEACFNELRSYRAPPQRVLAVVNTLCLMFRQPPGWESGKLLLIRQGFYEDLVFYDKKNVPDDIYNALEQICNVETFRPEYVAPGSKAAACFCEWILAIYNFAKFEKTIGFKSRELKDYEQLYNQRLVALGEKRMNSEKICQVLENYCASRKNVLLDIKKTHLEIDRLKEMEEKAQQLLKLFDDDHKSWTSQYNKSINLLKTHKLDALLTAFYICYAGIFDAESRHSLMSKWFNCLSKLQKIIKHQPSIKFDESQEGAEDGPMKYALRAHFNIRDIIINAYEYKDLMMQINKIGLKDDFFINNALILREHCSMPSTMSWPLIYDPENLSLKVLAILQESIDTLKNNINNEFVSSSPIASGSAPPHLKNTSMHAPPRDQGLSATSAQVNANESIIAEHTMSANLADDMDDNRDINRPSGYNLNQDDDNFKQSEFDATSQANIDAESLPPYSNRSSRLSYHSKKSAFTQISERSSIWEASTFYSRAQTAATVYHTKSGRPFLPSLVADYEKDLVLPVIETDLNIMPKDNLAVLDASDPNLEYKLINAAVHGVSVFLKNIQRYKLKSRLAEILIERDFLCDSNSNKEFLKFGDDEITISPSFKIILQASVPIGLNYGGKNNNLVHRLTSQFSAANFVVDFSLSPNYVSTDFLKIIMDYEKPGYLNQTILADKIMIDSEFGIFNRQEEILDRLNTIDRSILEDNNMIKYCIDKNTKLKEFNDALSESVHME